MDGGNNLLYNDAAGCASKQNDGINMYMSPGRCTQADTMLYPYIEGK